MRPSRARASGEVEEAAIALQEQAPAPEDLAAELGRLQAYAGRANQAERTTDQEAGRPAAVAAHTAGTAGGPSDAPRVRGIEQAPGATRALTDPRQGESFGLLIGTYGARGRIRILETASAPADASGRAWAAWIERAKHRLSTDGGERAVVGWYRTCPGAGVELRPEDRRIYAEHFGGWWQLALLVDPLEREHALYGRVDGEVRALGGKRRSAEARAPARSPRSTESGRALRARSDEAPSGEAVEESGRDPAHNGTAVWGLPLALIVPLLAGLLAGVVLTLLV